MGGTDLRERERERERKFQTYKIHSVKMRLCCAWWFIFKAPLCINWQRQGRTRIRNPYFKKRGCTQCFSVSDFPRVSQTPCHESCFLCTVTGKKRVGGAGPAAVNHRSLPWAGLLLPSSSPLTPPSSPLSYARSAESRPGRCLRRELVL
jgi:hypothetical protein